MWGYMGSEYGWGGMFIGMLWMLLFWIVLIAATVMVVRYIWATGSHAEQRNDKTALNILKERYARGEIEREEFEQKKRDLKD